VEELRHAIIFGNIKSNVEKYKLLAYEFYQMLFPEKIDKEIRQFIIVPSGNLANIPFEALLTGKVSENQKIKDFPYLINQFSISYAYSADLYYLTSKKQKQEKLEIPPINDWLALAPVFSDESTSGISFLSRNVLKQISGSIDTLKTRSILLNGNYVSPLPGTENEVKSIFNSFDKSGKKAVVKLHQFANESFVKSYDLKNYKYIHFATHGFVDSEKPELSGILLAQDTTGGNDGILFSGEIYNLPDLSGQFN
jgi:CHAT domain-containing protein